MAKVCVDCLLRRPVEGRDRCEYCQAEFDRTIANNPHLQDIGFYMVCIDGLPKIAHPEVQQLERLAAADNRELRLPCEAHILDDTIRIDVMSISNKERIASFTIPHERIIDIDFITKTNIEEKQKSVVGRAIVGGMLFGGAGAVVGGLSGQGIRADTTYTIVFAITYETKGGKVSSLLFDPSVTGTKKNPYDCRAFQDAYNSKFPPVQADSVEVIEEEL